ncbi:MAG: discoidin domain-containing protein [Pirellulales bacterium]|nr:discoidin domain-containing protein [Pirellulales bacterium]
MNRAGRRRDFRACRVVVIAVIWSSCPAVAAVAALANAPSKITLCDGTTAGAICVPPRASAILLHAAAVMQQGVERLSGRRPKLIEGNPEGCSLVLSVKSAAADVLTPSECAAMGDEGYVAKIAATRHGPQMLLIGGSDRGVLYGAGRLVDLNLQASGDQVTLSAEKTVQAPALALRGNYTLACWGKTHLYTRNDWRHIFDTMSADSMNVVMFWLSGLFPSQKQPESVVYPETKIGVDDVRAMIRHAHQRGLRFLLGSGIFAWFGVDNLAKKYPETCAAGSGGMCPSNPLARKLNREYLLEMLDAFPEADGFFLEIRDEYGPCLCPVCQRRLDERGSRQYGQAELSFLRELTAEVWRRNPEAIFISTVGYGDESNAAHSDDVLFYQGIRQMHDPRLFWLVCRGNWDFPSADGRQPLRNFSANMLQWTQYYRLSVSDIGQWIRRSQEAGCQGFCPALEPGFCSASWYSEDVPYPVDAIPYAVTRFAYREYCWTPAMSAEALRCRLSKRFFGPDASAHLADDLLGLFDLIRTQSQDQGLSGGSPWPRGCLARLIDEAEKGQDKMERSETAPIVPRSRLAALAALVQQRAPELDRMEQRLSAAEPGLSARGLETLALMRRALADTRRELCLEPKAAERVRRTADRLNHLLADRRKAMPAAVQATSQWNDTKYPAENVLDGDVDTSWLCPDRSALPQTLTVTLRRKQKIDYVRIVQGNYHPAYNSRAYRVESSADAATFSALFNGELPNRPGAAHVERFAPVEAVAVRVVITSVYPNVEYSSPSLAEVDLGLGPRSCLSPEKR